MNMRMIAAGMFVAERPNLGQSKRQYEDAEQGEHRTLGPYCLFF